MNELEIMRLHSSTFENTGYAKLEVSNKGNFIITEVNDKAKHTFVYSPEGKLLSEAVKAVKFFEPEPIVVLKWESKFTGAIILFEPDEQVMITAINAPAPQPMKWRTKRYCHTGFLLPIKNFNLDTWHFDVSKCYPANDFETNKYLQLKKLRNEKQTISGTSG